MIDEAVTDPLDRQLALHEAVAAAGGMWRLLAARCVSPADALQAGRWKVPQLRKAHELGFNVPETIVTSSIEAAREFVRAGPTVVKAVQDAHAQIGSEFLTGFTEPVSVNELVNVEVTPVVLQRQVQKVADYRVTVVGGRVFAARMVRPPDAHVDVRATASPECQIAPTKLAPVVADACRRFARDASLRFAALDLAEDQEGSLWFLECNPNGQWGWIEGATGQPITDALIDTLLALGTEQSD